MTRIHLTTGEVHVYDDQVWWIASDGGVLVENSHRQRRARAGEGHTDPVECRYYPAGSILWIQDGKDAPTSDRILQAVGGAVPDRIGDPEVRSRAYRSSLSAARRIYDWTSPLWIESSATRKSSLVQGMLQIIRIEILKEVPR